MAARRELEIGPDLRLPLSWMTMATVVYGNRGTGKSTLGRVFAEEVVNHNQRFCAIDVAGAFWGLKASASGTDTGLPIVIFGGEHADVPLEPGAGEKVAEIVASIGQSVILDFELMSKGRQIAFLGPFLERLYHVNRDPLLLLMDEAQRYAPQKPMSVEANKTLGATEDIVKLGRRHGLGPVVFTQRGSGLNKEVSELADVLVAFRSPGVLDRARVKEWLEANATADQQKEVLAQLSGLPTGTAIVASNHPDLPIFGTFQIRRPLTFDSSATPKPGERRIEPRVLAQTDIEALKVEMAEAIERAAAEDPRELRKQISQLKDQVASQDRVIRMAAERQAEVMATEIKLVPIIDVKVQSKIEELVDLLQTITDQVDPVEQRAEPVKIRTQYAVTTKDLARSAVDRAEVRRLMPPIDREASNGGEVNKAERAFLSALVQYPEGMSRSKLAVLTGYKATSGHIGNTLSSLRMKGLIERGDPIVITDAGRELVRDVEPLPPPGPRLLAHWMAKLGKTEQAFLEVIVDVYPEPISGQEVAERTGYKPTSGHVGNTLSLLRTKGLIEGPASAVRATEALVGA